MSYGYEKNKILTPLNEYANFILGKEFTEGMRRVISTNMKFTLQMFAVLGPKCHNGLEIVKTIEHSYEMMDIISDDELKEKLNKVSLNCKL